MLQILLFVFIGKQFSKLAETYNKKKWLYIILGIVSYFTGELIGGLILGSFDALLGWNIDWDNRLLMSVIGLPFGLATTYLFHYLLKRNFEQNKPEELPSIQDIGKPVEEDEEPKFRI